MNMLVIDHEYAPARETLRSEVELSLFPGFEIAPPGAERAAEPDGDLGAEVETEASVPLPSAVPATCRMDVATTPEGLEICLEAPGVREQDVEIEVSGETLTVRGVLRREADRPGRMYRVTERDYGPFHRSIDLPGSVPADRITASLDRGLLTILIPNPIGPRTTRVAVQSAPTWLTEVPDGLVFAMPAPGLGEEDLEVEVVGRKLIVTGVRGRGVRGKALDRSEADDSLVLRVVDLPADVRTEQITAELCRGVLTVTLPRHADAGPQRVRVRAS